MKLNKKLLILLSPEFPQLPQAQKEEVILLLKDLRTLRTHLLGLSHFKQSLSEWVNISSMPLSCLIEQSGSWQSLLRFARGAWNNRVIIPVDTSCEERVMQSNTLARSLKGFI